MSTEFVLVLLTPRQASAIVTACNEYTTKYRLPVFKGRYDETADDAQGGAREVQKRLEANQKHNATPTATDCENRKPQRGRADCAA